MPRKRKLPSLKEDGRSVVVSNSASRPEAAQSMPRITTAAAVRTNPVVTTPTSGAVGSSSTSAIPGTTPRDTALDSPTNYMNTDYRAIDGRKRKLSNPGDVADPLLSSQPPIRRAAAPAVVTPVPPPAIPVVARPPIDSPARRHASRPATVTTSSAPETQPLQRHLGPRPERPEQQQQQPRAAAAGHALPLGSQPEATWPQGLALPPSGATYVAEAGRQLEQQTVFFRPDQEAHEGRKRKLPDSDDAAGLLLLPPLPNRRTAVPSVETPVPPPTIPAAARSAQSTSTQSPAPGSAGVSATVTAHSSPDPVASSPPQPSTQPGMWPSGIALPRSRAFYVAEAGRQLQQQAIFFQPDQEAFYPARYPTREESQRQMDNEG
ncbi:hypothetical protein F4780DRAFT_776192 [Xylariomycetidae sp. FL0641]|nr:hypothetical protein F4780DRAFT_776192 [Xylariomycetidae sp. FL0641]